VSKLREARVAVAPILDVPKICASEHTKARNMLVEFEHASAGKVRLAGNPVKYGAYDAIAELPPPFKGQHTTEVLAALGYGETDIRRLHDSGIIGDGYITRTKK
jgi:crotonobetainyl-CoA:carnitine CoA-transferase CaiB-like acyl-CoA transferase